MRLLWQRYRDDIVAVCVILGMVTGTLTFFGFAPKDQPPPIQSTPPTECQVQRDQLPSVESIFPTECQVEEETPNN